MIAVSYGSIYVAQIAMGANDAQTLRAFLEAEAYDGPSLIIAYSHCIAHGIDMTQGLSQQKLATESAYWPLYRFDPRLRGTGKNPFQLDSRAPKVALKDYMYKENRYRMLAQSHPETAAKLLTAAEKAVAKRWQHYAAMAERQED
jgi:pyruvate-ferredoxin/flavodoxin oxidoreductase